MSSLPAADPAPTLLGQLVRDLPAWLAVFDRSGTVTFGNPAWLAPAVAGAVSDTLIRFNESDRAALAAMVRRAIDDGAQTVGELSAAAPDGARRLHAIRVAPLQGDDGSVTHAVLVGVDITESTGLRERLSQGHPIDGVRAESLPQNIIRYDLSGRATYANRELSDRYLIVGGSVIGRRPHEVAPVGSPGMDEYERALDRVLATGEPAQVEMTVMERTGRVRVHLIELSAEGDEQGRITGALAVGRDLTDQVRAREALAQKEREFRSLAENAGDIIIRWDPQAVTLYVNPAFDRLYMGKGHAFVGLKPTALARRNTGSMRALEERVVQVAAQARPDLMELRFSDPTTQRLTVHELRLVPEFDGRGQVVSVLGVGRDVTEKITHLELIESLLHVDPLTQLANRRALRERAAGLISAAQRRHSSLGVLLLDLDQFKAINDGLGHSAGDELLVELARRLNSRARAEDLVARLGGDEFVLLAPDMNSAADMHRLADRLHESLAPPMTVAGREVRVTMSVGVALYPADGSSLEDLLANADAAMYEAKRTGRGRTAAYTAALGESVRRRLALEQSLRSAAQDGSLELRFQPVVDLAMPSRMLGAEALVRWKHPTLGLLLPDQFIPLAEESELIVDIGRWVLHEALRTVVHWNRQGAHALHVAINVSPRQFHEPGFVADLADALHRFGCQPSWLWLEITEGALVSDASRLERVLAELRFIGVRVSIDDFGTGYSALNYLARFPIDQLKIDKAFVHSIGRSPRDDELLKAFVAIAAALRLDAVAEGLETEEQAAFLRAMGCRQAQGYLFGAPMTDSAFQRLLHEPATP